MSYVAALHLCGIKLDTKLIRSLRLLYVGHERSFYKRGGGVKGACGSGNFCPEGMAEGFVAEARKGQHWIQHSTFCM